MLLPDYTETIVNSNENHSGCHRLLSRIIEQQLIKTEFIVRLYTFPNSQGRIPWL
jgi:hypothetical protein